MAGVSATVSKFAGADTDAPLLGLGSLAERYVDNSALPAGGLLRLSSERE